MNKSQFQFALLLLCLVAMGRVALGQSITLGSIRSSTTLEVKLSHSLTGDPGSCSVLDISHERLLEVTSCKLLLPAPTNVIVIEMGAPVTLDSAASYVVILKGLSFVTAGLKNQVQGTISQPTPKDSGTCTFFRFQQLLNGGLDSAGDRNGSDIYFSGQTTHSRGGDFQGTYDAKVDLSGRCTFWGRVNRIGPTLDLKGGNDPNGDPDSLNFSWMWEMPVISAGSSNKIGALRLKQNATFQSTQDFTQRDFIYDVVLREVLRPWIPDTSGIFRAHFFPEFGVEAGKNVRGVIPAVDGRNIARPKIGASILVIVDRQKKVPNGFSLETSYTRRWPLIPEVTFKQASGGGFTSVHIGTNPRDYVKEALNFNVTKFLGFSAAYEYGSLPPKYKFLDSKFTFGLNLKAAFK